MIVMSSEKGNMDIAKDAIWENRKIKLRSFTKNKMAMFGLVLTVIMVLAAILAPLLTPYDPIAMETTNRFQAPSMAHLFGTDEFGRDILTRTVYGIRISLIIGAATAAITFVAGMILGLLAAYFTFLDNLIMRICEGMMSIPSILMGIALMSVLGTESKNVVIALSIVYTPVVARVARAAALTVKEMTYVEAIKSQGAGWMRILFKHIAPNTLSSVIVQATYIFATAIILEAALSFLGAGIPAPTPSMGNILNEAKQYIFNSWWLTLFPSIVMILLVMGINILGDGIRDVMDPTAN
ncbi:MAG: ABC transporter permease [Clostridia bacterium]|nr:ABC transporter permease [Clostridia bacterium]NCD01558.1 ABC transporter permease [Clostridia bacterium]